MSEDIDFQNRIDTLTSQLEDANYKAEEAKKQVESLESRLLEVADHYVADGLITDTPYAKRLWIEKGIR